MAKFDLAMHKGRIQGHLNIFSSSVPRKYILPQIIKDFSNKYPDVSFTLSDKDSKNVVQSILNADTDFGIVGAKHPYNNLDYIELMEDNLVLITPNNSSYTEPNYSSLKLNTILNEKFIFREKGSGTRNLLENKLKEKGIDTKKLSVFAYIEDTETIKELVSLGLGISFISQKAIKDDIKLGKYKVYYVEDLNLYRKFYFVYHNKRQLSPLNETFKEFVLDYIEKISI